MTVLLYATMSEFVNNDVSSGAVVFASDHNTQGALLAAVLNGGLDNDNIASGAAIAGTKLATDGVTDTQLDYPRWWHEIGRTTLGSAGDTISITSLPARKYLKILVLGIPSSTINVLLRFNNDSGSNYAGRGSVNGGADATGSSASSITLSDANAAHLVIAELVVLNVAAQEKIVEGHFTRANAAGAGNVPTRQELVAKWANTADQISRVDILNTQAGSFDTGSEVVVLGHD